MLISAESSSVLDFNNGCFLGFNTVFESISQYNEYRNLTLVSHLPMDEGSGNFTFDESANNNDGLIIGATWVEGKNKNALGFDGLESIITIPHNISQSLIFPLSFSGWFKPDRTQNDSTSTVLNKGNNYQLKILRDGTVIVSFNNGTAWQSLRSSVKLPNLDWSHVYGSLEPNGNNTKITLCINGLRCEEAILYGQPTLSTKNLTIGAYSPSIERFKGSIDEIHIYNGTLVDGEIMGLHLTGDPLSFSRFYKIKEISSNKTMLISLQKMIDFSGNVSLVICNDFFADNKLYFRSNGTVIINIWTSLGRPVFTTGLWNSENFTTTLEFDSIFIGEIDWNAVPPMASNISTTGTYAGNSTIFTASWADNRSLSGGGYIFSTNNTGKWVNSTWTAFTSNPNWANVTLTLNNTVGVNVSFREYANNTVGIWGVSENYAIETTAFDGTILSPTPSATSTTIPTTSPTTTPNVTSLTPTSTSNFEPTGTFSTQTILTVTGVVIALLFIVFALSLKKGIIKIEVVN